MTLSTVFIQPICYYWLELASVNVETCPGAGKARWYVRLESETTGFYLCDKHQIEVFDSWDKAGPVSFTVAVFHRVHY